MFGVCECEIRKFTLRTLTGPSGRLLPPPDTAPWVPGLLLSVGFSSRALGRDRHFRRPARFGGLQVGGWAIPHNYAELRRLLPLPSTNSSFLFFTHPPIGGAGRTGLTHDTALSGQDASVCLGMNAIGPKETLVLSSSAAVQLPQTSHSSWRATSEKRWLSKHINLALNSGLSALASFRKIDAQVSGSRALHAGLPL